VVPKYPFLQDVVAVAELQVFAPVAVHYAHYPVAESKKYPSLQVTCLIFVHVLDPLRHAKHNPSIR